MKHPFEVKENIHLIVKDKDGKVLDEVKLSNLFVTVGKTKVRDLMGSATGPFTHVAIGTGVTAPVVGNTTLETETTRLAAAVTFPTVDNVQFEAAFLFGIAGTASETAVFDNAVGGVMANRSTFTTLNIPSGGTLTVRIDFTIS